MVVAFERFVRKEMEWNALDGALLKDEVPYHLLHRIIEGEGAFCLRSSERDLILAQTPGHNAWLWVSGNAAADRRNILLAGLIQELRHREHPLPGVTAEERLAAAFAEQYATTFGVASRLSMRMEAYSCPAVVQPLGGVSGTHRPAQLDDAHVVAEWLVGFSEDAYSVPTTAEEQAGAAKQLVQAGGLTLWIAEDGSPVSMANVAHCSARHARINAVYTPRRARKQGYASAIVGAISEKLLAEGLTPMLYADLANPDSNGVYRKLGYIPCGRLAEYKFVPR